MYELEQDIDFSKISYESNESMKIENKLNSIYHSLLVEANKRAKNLEGWKVNESTYIIDAFLKDFQDARIAIFDFSIEQKEYTCKYDINNECITQIIKDFSNNKNKKNVYFYSNDLANQLFDIFVDFIEVHNNKSIFNMRTKDELLEIEEIPYNYTPSVQSTFTARLKNFERDLLINKFSDVQNDIDNSEMRALTYGSSDLMYVSSGEYFFIFSYMPANEQYYNPKLKVIDQVPSYSFFIYKKNIENFFIENFATMNLLHKSFVQFTFYSDTNQNIVNAMGEASLISQYWYTTSVQKILNDHDVELQKSKDSRLLSEYIIKYIFAAEINGVNTIEVYPFDRIFIFNHGITDTERPFDFRVVEALIESKVVDKNIKDKKFLGGQTRYAYEWERKEAGLELEKFNPSKKKVKFINIDEDLIKKISIPSTAWEKSINKDTETVVNNLLYNALTKNKKDDNSILEYESKYFKDDMLYLYASGLDLDKIPVLKELQYFYLKNIPEDKNDAIEHGCTSVLTENQKYFENIKIVLFSYNPKEKKEKGFTLLVIANQDVPKALMEQKSEKDDLFTALKLLINQHFTIDSRYRKKSEEEQKELIDILTQTKHAIKNSFDQFDLSINNINELKEKILNIVEQDKAQMEEQGRNAIRIEFKKLNKFQNNSVDFLKAIFSCNGGATLNRKFQDNSLFSWDVFAQNIFELSPNAMTTHRMHSFEWEDLATKNKLILRINLNDIPDFYFEWKESLFNDAIYVMLKNACEHTLCSYTGLKQEKEIFLDLYISKYGSQDIFNIEFTNETDPICKNLFDHINSGLDIKNNSRKNNSSGIGVVTIRKRLQVTYGLELSNIIFNMVQKNKIKSKLYFPVNIIESDDLFLSEQECIQNAKILYLEDTDDIAFKNKKQLENFNLKYIHSKGFYPKDNSYENYSILVTDLNILGEGSQKPNITNGEDAIKYFTDKNIDHGIVIILSTDNYNPIKIPNDYAIEEYSSDLQKLAKKTIYKTNIKEINTKLLELIGFAIKDQSYTAIKVDKKSKMMPTEIISSKSIKYRESSIFPFAKLRDLCSDNNLINKQNVDNVLFYYNSISEKLPLDLVCSEWQNYKVIQEFGEHQPLSNSEVTYKFNTKLIIKLYEQNQSYGITHEGLKHNILFLAKNITDAEMVKIANETLKIEMHKQGIFSKISHDIIEKMQTFSNYNEIKIHDLKLKNNSLRNDFINIFKDKIISGSLSKEIIQKTNEEYEKFLEELEKLLVHAKDNNNTLSTSLSNLESTIATMNFIKNLTNGKIL